MALSETALFIRRPAMFRLAAAVFAVSACGTERGASPSVPVWILADSPTVEIGAREGAAPYLFENVVDVEFTDDGQLVIADAGSSAIRVFAADGDFVREFGGRGEGPGEFRTLSEIWVASYDTLGAWDSGARRLTYFGPDGGVRTSPIDPAVFDTLGHANLDLGIGRLSDGSVVLGALRFGAEDFTGTDRVAVLRFTPDGQFAGQIGEGTGLVRRLFEGGSRKAPIPYSPFPYFAVEGESVYHIVDAEPKVKVWSLDGTNELSFPAVEHDLESAWTDLHDSLEARNAEYFSELYPLVSPPEEAAQLAGLVVDSEGRIWTKQYEPRTDSFWLGDGGRVSGGTWWVSDSNGELLAEVQLPGSFSPYQVVDDRVVGVATDSLGVQTVQVWRLEVAN